MRVGRGWVALLLAIVAVHAINIDDDAVIVLGSDDGTIEDATVFLQAKKGLVGESQDPDAAALSTKVFEAASVVDKLEDQNLALDGQIKELKSASQTWRDGATEAAAQEREAQDKVDTMERQLTSERKVFDL